MYSSRSLWGAVLLVTGTSVGAAMLAFPVSTAHLGFLPTCVIFIISWLAMLFAGLVMLETNLQFGPQTNLISMAGETLGWPGKLIAWVSYTLLLYALLAAYLTGMSDILIQGASHTLHQHITLWQAGLLLTLLFASMVYTGADSINRVNRSLMMVFAFVFVLLCLVLSSHIEVTRLWVPRDPGRIVSSLPVVITAFGFHIVIPSLRQYLQNDAARLSKAIILGSMLSLVVYLIWEMVVFGVLPLHGPDGLVALAVSGHPTVDLTRALQDLYQYPVITLASKLVVFLTITTSFIGVSFSLFDFLSDGLHVSKNRLNRMGMVLLTFGPPLLFAIYYPEGFVTALSYAGFFVAVLLCLLPVAMVLSVRSQSSTLKRSHYRAPGGYLALLFIVLYAVVSMAASAGYSL